ncbi:MAG: hypothetical protein HY981_01640 [Candidatus Magasanikbacteria bacterium]|nr:hypothetical protein [Candidatus Magasanikbacteria bacterium]
MKLSQLFTKTSKASPAEAESVNAQLLARAGFVYQQMAGVYNYLPLGLRVLKKIQHIVREEMDALGGQELLMPTLTSEADYKKTGRDTIDVLFRTEGHSKSALVLNPSHEEVVTPLVQKFVFSYNDLPTAVYQIQTKFRNEPRAKSGLLRGREFMMKDMYSFHTSEDDLNTFYERALERYHKVYTRLGLGDLTVVASASGGMFTKDISHEFQTLCPIGEDTIYLCEKCNKAVNQEISMDHARCPQCGASPMVEKKSIEVGNIFKLKTKYTSAFDFKYKDETGITHPVIMGCYGIGISRLMGALVEVFHDDKGMIWPESVAPFKVHLMALGNDESARAKTDELYETLTRAGVEALYDDRVKASTGEKLSDADLIGIPYRVIVSPKTLAENAVEIKKRDEKEARLASFAHCVSELM